MTIKFCTAPNFLGVFGLQIIQPKQLYREGTTKLRVLLEHLYPDPSDTFVWLVTRNTAIKVLPGTYPLPIRVLLELKSCNWHGFLWLPYR